MCLKNKKVLITFLVIFIISLVPRVIGLNRVGILADEERWIDRGSEYVNQTFQGNFIQATRNFERHPGVPAAFLMGLSVKFFSDGDQNKYKYEAPPVWKYSLKLIEPLAAARLPIAVLGAAEAALLFWFVFRIWKNYSLALISGIFLAFDPFHISISKMAHQDITLSLFFMLTIFTYYIGYKENKNWLRILSGVFWGLAFLTKIVAIMLPISLIIWKTIEEIRKNKNYRKILFRKLPFDLIDIAAIFIGIIMFFVFYTRIWTNPMDEFIKHLLLNLEGKNLEDSYFLFGKVENESSFIFYLVQIFIRLTEITLISLVVGLMSGIIKMIKEKSISSIALLTSIASFLVWFSLSSTGKMKDRYILPVWPFIMILAASGLIIILRFLLKRYWENKKIAYSAAIIIIAAFAARPLIYFYPYHFLYYNKFIGDIKNAEKITLVSRGEGMKEAAEYLNQKPNAENLTVIVTYRDSFNAYFKGKVARLEDDEWRKNKTPDGIDYVVFFVRGVQKKSFGSLYKRFVLNDIPEQVINLKGLDVAYIYKVTPK